MSESDFEDDVTVISEKQYAKENEKYQVIKVKPVIWGLTLFHYPVTDVNDGILNLCNDNPQYCKIPSSFRLESLIDSYPNIDEFMIDQYEKQSLRLKTKFFRRYEYIDQRNYNWCKEIAFVMSCLGIGAGARENIGKMILSYCDERFSRTSN